MYVEADGPSIAEQAKMNDCYFEKRDWRSCSKEASLLNPNGFAPRRRLPVLRLGADLHGLQMEAFRECWKKKGNEQRTQSKDT